MNRPLRNRRPDRRGSIIVLTALLLVVLIGMLAYAIDLGYIANTHTEVRMAADAAAFAGAGALINGTTAANTEALKFLALNKVGGRTLGASNAVIEFGAWNTTTRTFGSTTGTPSAIRVTATDTSQPLFFAGVFGKKTFDTSAKAVAVYQPRDIVMVLDYSASMCFDSQFRNLGLLSQSTIQSNLAQIWSDLGSPKYGKLNWTPVLYKDEDTSNSKVKSNFGLDKVTYPYPDGSWDEYIDYVQTDNYIDSAGYQCKYGMMTFVNYLQAKRSSVYDTPGLYNTSEQPVTSLKDAVDEFLDYLTTNSTDDQVGLAIYTALDGTAKLESGLTKTFSTISSICRARQAGLEGGAYRHDRSFRGDAGSRPAGRSCPEERRAGARLARAGAHADRAGYGRVEALRPAVRRNRPRIRSGGPVRPAIPARRTRSRRQDPRPQGRPDGGALASDRLSDPPQRPPSATPLRDPAPRGAGGACRWHP